MNAADTIVEKATATKNQRRAEAAGQVASQSNLFVPRMKRNSAEPSPRLQMRTISSVVRKRDFVGPMEFLKEGTEG